LHVVALCSFIISRLIFPIRVAIVALLYKSPTNLHHPERILARVRRRERFYPAIGRLRQLQKQNPTASIATLLDQHGAADPQLWAVREFLDSMTPLEQQRKQREWESVSKSPLPSEPCATESIATWGL
jgi:hypothetical protein